MLSCCSASLCNLGHIFHDMNLAISYILDVDSKIFRSTFSFTFLCIEQFALSTCPNWTVSNWRSLTIPVGLSGHRQKPVWVRAASGKNGTSPACRVSTACLDPLLLPFPLIRERKGLWNKMGLTQGSCELDCVANHEYWHVDDINAKYVHKI